MFTVKKVLNVVVVLTIGCLLSLSPLAGYAAETLNLMTWEGYVTDEIVQQFEESTGIKVNITYIADNGEIISKLKATGGSGWDLAQPSQDQVRLTVVRDGSYQPIDLSRIPNLKNVIASQVESVKMQTSVDGKLYAIPYTWGTSGLIVNTKKVPAEMTSYKDLCDPQFKGRVTYRAKWPTMVGAGYGMGYEVFEVLGKDNGGDMGAGGGPEFVEMITKITDHLIACRDNVKAYWSSRQQNIDLLVKEEVYTAQGWDGTGWLITKDHNPDIKFIAPKEGALGWIDTFAIPTGAENVDAAYKWINFMYQAEVSGQVIKGGGFLSSVDGALNSIDESQAALINESFSPEAIDNINWYVPKSGPQAEIINEALERLKTTK